MSNPPCPYCGATQPPGAPGHLSKGPAPCPNRLQPIKEDRS